MTDEEILAVAHRTATIYRHRSEPESPSYGFVNHTMIDFARKISQAATAAKDAEIAALKAERDRYRQALEAMTKKEPCDCGCPSGESVVILKPTHYYAIASDALKGDAAIAKAEGIVK